MATLNCYPMDPGKPMIHNKESAARFFRWCKQPIRFRMASGFGGDMKMKTVEIQYPEIRCVESFEIGDSGIGMDVVSWWIKDEDACIRWIWERRKMINARFKGE